LHAFTSDNLAPIHVTSNGTPSHQIIWQKYRLRNVAHRHIR